MRIVTERDGVNLVSPTQEERNSKYGHRKRVVRRQDEEEDLTGEWLVRQLG